MSNVEWREITWDNAHEHIGKPVRALGRRNADIRGQGVSGILAYASSQLFALEAFENDPYEWSKSQLAYAWYPASGNIVLTETASIKHFVENMDAQGGGRL